MSKPPISDDSRFVSFGPLAFEARRIIYKLKPEALICTPETRQALIEELSVGPVKDICIYGAPVEAVAMDNCPLGTFVAAWDVKYDSIGVCQFTAKWDRSNTEEHP